MPSLGGRALSALEEGWPAGALRKPGYIELGSIDSFWPVFMQLVSIAKLSMIVI